MKHCETGQGNATMILHRYLNVEISLTLIVKRVSDVYAVVQFYPWFNFYYYFQFLSHIHYPKLT